MSTIVFSYDGTPIPDVLWQSASFECQMGGVPGVFTVTVRDTLGTYDFQTGKQVSLDVDGERYYGGFVTQVTKQFAFPVDRTDDLAELRTRQWVLHGVDYNILFDKRVIINLADPLVAPARLYGEPTDSEIIDDLCSNYLELSDIAVDWTTYVDDVGDSDPDHDYYEFRNPGDTWRQQMKDITQWTGAIYYIDPNLNLHYHSIETVTAPWGFSDTPDGVTTFGFREFSYTEDGSNLVNDAIVWGGAEWQSTGVTAAINYGRWTNTDSLNARGRWQRAEAHFNENGWASDAKCEMHAKIIVEGDPGAAGAGLTDTVRGLVNPQKQIRLSWFSNDIPSPLVLGSVITTDLNSFSASYALPVRSVRISFVTPSEARFDGFFGIQTDDPWTLWKYMRQLQNTSAPAPPFRVSDGSVSSAGSKVSMAPIETPNGVIVDFTVTDIFVAGSAEVTMNGLAQRLGYEYVEDPVNKTISFYDAPLTGDALWITYNSIGS